METDLVTLILFCLSLKRIVRGIELEAEGLYVAFYHFLHFFLCSSILRYFAHCALDPVIH